MFASVQYLLAGLKVVTTPSEGGRDEFFDAEYVDVVTASPDAVAAGVRRQVLSDRLDPLEIHCRTVAKMEAHRERLLGVVQTFFSDVGESRSFRDDWPMVFRHQLFNWQLFGQDQARAINRLNDQISHAVKTGQPYVPADRLL